ncbi:hypothetical protein BDQ12DRAFT_737807 [Crucibulum laeve]|uniref:N-acetyltransferase domain-containing protein n=1 Tax=Crucibulum laeve TaxID=68775 RepID=A0A5C3LPK3_9AGAR|nr:hypothetical protein BDQ12DRAFT_737807 [Crucibulum laeve]
MTAPSSMYEYTVRKLGTMSDDQLKQIEVALEKAFAEDQYTAVVTSRDREFYGTFFGSIIIAGLLGGEVYVAEDVDKTIVGVAAWYGPGRALYDSLDQQEKSLSILMQRFSHELSQWWVTDFLPKYNEFTAKALGEGQKLASWHLQALGVDPKFQRKGIARALVNIMKEKAAKEETPLCVECSVDINVGIYERLGFEVKGQTTLVGIPGTGEFPLWIMWQDIPKAA